jgi:shikimate kinase
MNIILFGFKGSGKTHFGKLLAQKLHRPFIDTDSILEELYAKESKERLRIWEIYQAVGETGFRTLETEAIATLYEIKGAVISLGGGAVLDKENVEMLLKIGQLVYLEASFDTIQKRIQKTPPFTGDIPLQTLYRERKPVYESVPSRKIDTDALDEAGVLAALQAIACLEEPPNGF